MQSKSTEQESKFYAKQINATRMQIQFKAKQNNKKAHSMQCKSPNKKANSIQSKSKP
jgi:hypothetical protein